MKRVLAAVVIGSVGILALTVSPSQQDFGKVGINGSKVHSFRVTMGAPRVSDSLVLNLVGADPQDFVILDGSGFRVCALPNPNGNPVPAGVCDVEVEFRPKSLGPKSARLEVNPKVGASAYAALTGIGVQPICEMKVVFCNYSHLYTGSFSWQSALLGPYGENRLSVTVTVVNGVATCSGSETSVTISDGPGGTKYRTTEVGTILGKGLIAIEFEPDSADKPIYRITGACPSPVWQASRNLPSEPAELGSSYYEHSNDQPADSGQVNLSGSYSTPHPATDQLNGVSGSLRVTWSLKRS